MSVQSRTETTITISESVRNYSKVIEQSSSQNMAIILNVSLNTIFSNNQVEYKDCIFFLSFTHYNL